MSRGKGAPRPGLRMAELSQRTGVPRETIHYYLREGLLPRPRKGGRTTAFYDEEHVERLRTIRRLREEKYLPLAVIRRLLASPAAERDADVLAEVLSIDPTTAEPPPRAPSAEASREAAARGLLGPARQAGDDARDPAEARALALIAEALALPEGARALTLDDLAICAEHLAGLVSHEAVAFFDRVLATGDVPGSVAALRAGRRTVARFVTAYRDLMLRRIVDELLIGIQESRGLVARARGASLSERAQAALGVPARRADLVARARRGDARAAAALVRLDFACGREADEALLAQVGPIEAALAAFAACERGAGALDAIEDAARRAGGSPLAAILAGEARLAWAVRGAGAGAGLLEAAVPALQRVVTADPELERDAFARALGWLHRGRVELALPAVIGRKARGAAALARALVLADEDPALEAPIGAAVALRAHLWLGREREASGDREAARAHFSAARRIDPDAPAGLPDD
jgi:DNA-binding transcriptional MerR regulator